MAIRHALKFNWRVVSFKHVHCIAIRENIVFGVLAEQVELHAILFQVFDDERIAIVEGQLKSVNANQFQVVGQVQHKFVVFALLTLRGQLVLVEQTIELSRIFLVEMSLGNAPRVNSLLLKLLHVNAALLRERAWKVVLDNLERSSVVDGHALVHCVEALDDRDCEELVADGDPANEDFAVARQFILSLNREHTLLL